MTAKLGANGLGKTRTVVSYLEDGFAQSRVRRTIATGFEPLDSILDGGIRTGDLVLLGGLPGIGKTIAALQWARNAAATGDTAIYASYEHDAATMMSRLLLLEVGELTRTGGEPSDPQLRKVAMEAIATPGGLDEAVLGHLVLRAAKARLAGYGEALWLAPASPTEVDVDALERLVDERAGDTTVLFVDHLQKVGSHRAEMFTVDEVAVQLKSLAIRAGIAVVGVVGTDTGALGSRRVRLHHLQEAAGVGYEADLVVLMNEKLAAVSRRHTAFDSLRADEYRNRVVFSIEKNRSGPANVNLDFAKDFVHYRFDPQGRVLEEQLVDGLLIPD
jgi:replicative DNA helicase